MLLTLVSSTDRDERKFVVEKILERRGEEDFGSLEVRPRRTPAIDTQAKSLATLISWDRDVHETVFTAKVSKKGIKPWSTHPSHVPTSLPTPSLLRGLSDRCQKLQVLC